MSKLIYLFLHLCLSKMISMNNVTSVLIQKIFSNFTIKEISLLCVVNDKFRTICNEESLWKNVVLNVHGMKKTYPDIDKFIQYIQGNAATILPIPDLADHFIFSPPYPQGLKKKGAMDKTSQDLGYVQTAEYSEGMDNFTNMNDFIYHQRIELFDKKCFQSIRAGGTMTVIIKDKMEKGLRVRQADRTERDCLRIGFEPVARNKWLAMGGGYSAINRSAGLVTVDDEDLITLRVPGG